MEEEVEEEDDICNRMGGKRSLSFSLKIVPTNIKIIAHFKINRTSNCKIAKINTP